MARSPIQVHVLPFRRRNGEIEYCVLRRQDDGSWQGAAGGAENDENPAEAARRELREETQVPASAPLYALQSVCSVPISEINPTKRAHWPADLFVIPNWTFGVDCTGFEVKLSDEHTEYKWTSYERAHALLAYDNNKVALWELNERLKIGKLPAPV
jgi:dihydroneopterin triphosphate diphosphatase